MDLIDRQAAIEALENTKRSDPFDRYENQNIGIEWAIDALRALPAAQPTKRTNKRTETHACDCISRQAAIDALIRKIRPHNNGDGTITMWVMSEELVRETLNDLPSAQPEIIRCKECKWYNDRERTCNDLMSFGRYWKPDDFCSYGKRRTE